MAWVQTVAEEPASGKLAEVYQKVREWPGRCRTSPGCSRYARRRWGLACTASDGRPDRITKRERVLIATVVSKVNGCLYRMESHEKDLRSEVGSDEQRRAVQDDYRAAVCPRGRSPCSTS